MGWFDQPNNKKQAWSAWTNPPSKEENEAATKVIGYGGGALIGIAIALAIGPELIMGIIFSGLYLTKIDRRWLRLAGISGLILGVISYLSFGLRALFGWFGVAEQLHLLPAWLGHRLAECFNNGQEWQVSLGSLCLAITWGLALSLIGGLIINKLSQNYFTREREAKLKQQANSSKAKQVAKQPLKVTDKLQAKYRNKPQDKRVLVGANIVGKPVYEPIEQVFTHMLVQGTTGSGKTIAMLTYIEACLKNDMPVVFFDAKGDPRFLDEIGKLTKHYHKKLRVFTPESKITYNPLKNGTASEIEDRLMRVFDWSETYYKNASDNRLIKILQLIDDYNLPRDLDTLAQYLNYETIFNLLSQDRKRVQVVQEQEIEDESVTDNKVVDTEFLVTEKETQTERVNSNNKDQTRTKKVIIYSDKATNYMKSIFGKVLQPDEIDDVRQLNQRDHDIKGLRDQVEILQWSDLGKRKQFQDSDDEIDFVKWLDSDEVIIFLLNSNAYGNVIPKVGRFVIADIATAVTKRFNSSSQFKGAVGFFDEFGSYANDKIMDVLAKARSAKFGAVLGAQSISDFEVVDPNMVKRVFDNVNVYLLGRTNSAENAEIIAKSIGTYEDIDRTIMTEDKGGLLARIDTKAERGTIRNVHKYVVDPDQLKRCPNYQFFLVDKLAVGDDYAQRVYVRNALNGL